MRLFRNLISSKHKTIIMPGKETKLFDGEHRVDKITILSLFRNNETFLEYLLPKLKEMDDMYDVKFIYCFLENNSTDKTNTILKDFVDSRGDGSKLFTLDLPDYVNKYTNFERTDRLAMLRNTLVDMATPLQSEWAVMLDSDIYFDIGVLEEMFQIEPKKHKIGMLSTYACEAFRAKNIRHRFELPADVKDEQIITLNHYYDTFAFVDDKNQNYWPKCAFSACKTCNTTKHIQVDKPFVYVRSAFGGLAIIRTSILANPKIRWKSINLFGQYALCEHIAFCDAIENVTDLKVAVATSIRNKVLWIN
jgi:glycosyltransferase involved in cell wall biosynthesis